MTPLLGCHLRCPNRGIVQASSDAGFAQPFATKGNPERAPRTPGGTHRSKWWPRYQGQSRACATDPGWDAPLKMVAERRLPGRACRTRTRRPGRVDICDRCHRTRPILIQPFCKAPDLALGAAALGLATGTLSRDPPMTIRRGTRVGKHRVLIQSPDAVASYDPFNRNLAVAQSGARAQGGAQGHSFG